jgi:probable HAF family extracellular repeat protein
MHDRAWIALSLVAAIFVIASSTISRAASYTIQAYSDSANGVAINQGGHVTGDYLVPGGTSAYFWDGTIHYLGTLGGAMASGRSINAAGQVAGYSDLDSGFIHAFLWDGTMHDLGTLDGGFSLAYGINATGQVVGQDANNGSSRAFVYDAANGMIDLNSLIDPTSGWHLVSAAAINDAGQITGYGFVSSTGYWGAYIFDEGMVLDLGTVAGMESRGSVINAAGQVAGQLLTEQSHAISHAFFYDGAPHDLGTLGGANSEALGINDLGQVVGWSATSNGTSHAFIYDHMHGMIDLNSLIDPELGWSLSFASGINNAGQIVGGGNLNGQYFAVVLTPVPEPSTLALIACGLAAIVSCHWRGRTKSVWQ